MFAKKFFVHRIRRDQLRSCYLSVMYQQFQQQGTTRRSYVTKRLVAKSEPTTIEPTASDDGHYWPRKIFSGIQPTGDLHLGNYLGAVRKWTKLQETREDVTFCIVDMHSITVPQDPAALREQIFKMAATMLACGIDPNQSTLFVQSSVKEHSELCWLLGTLSTMARLGHLPQYKEKTRQMKEIPLGLFVYPVLQAADIMLYKTTHVPVGEDQLQHIQLTQHLAKTFNTRFGRTFPICHAMIDNKQCSRIRSLRDPTKKMSKSDPDPKSAINVSDEPEVITEKIKKAVTDFCSDVSYEPDTRLGVSNLITIHSQMSGQPIEKIIDEARTLDTGKYKLRVAEAIIEHLKPIREKIQLHMDERSELVKLLDNGAEKARNIACDTIEEVKQKMGLGAPYLPLFMDLKRSYGGGNSNGGNLNNLNGESEPTVQLPRQNMSAVAMATAAVNAVTGGNTAAPLMTSTMSYARPSTLATAAIKQTNANAQHAIEAKLTATLLEPTRKFNVVQKPVVPRQKIRIEKMNTMNIKSKEQVFDSLGEDLLSLSLLQRHTAAAAAQTATPTPHQALLPQYQQLADESLQEFETEQLSELSERNLRRVAAKIQSSETTTTTNQQQSACKSNNNNTNDDRKLFSSALTIAKPLQNNVELTPPSIKSKKLTTKPMQPSALVENVPAAVSPTAEVKAAVAAANAEIFPTPTTTVTLSAFLAEFANTFSTSTTRQTQQQQQQQNSTRNFSTFSSQLARSISTTSSSLSSQLFYSTQKYKNSKITSKEKFTKVLIYGFLAIGAGFSGVYYFWRRVLQAFFDAKKNDGS